MLKKFLLSGGVCVLLLVALAIGLVLHPHRFDTAPDVTFRIIDGRQIALKDLRGRPVLVTFRATTCPTCLKEMPHLISLYEELSGKGLEIVGVAMVYDPPHQVLDLATQRRVPYAIALDIDGSVAHAFDEVTLTPTTLLIAPDGRIIAHTVGELDMEKLHTQIADLLQQSQVTSNKLQGTNNDTGA